jgi:hypothetical protein
MPLPTLHKLPHIYIYIFQLNDQLLHSVCRQTAAYTVVIMKAVILVLLLVAATLVHSAPEDIGKSLHEYSKRSGDFIDALIEEGCPSLCSGYSYSYTTTQRNINMASPDIGMPHRRHSCWDAILSRRSVNMCGIYFTSSFKFQSAKFFLL